MPPTTPSPKEEKVTPPIRVRAIRTGFYNAGRKRPGDEFTVQSEREVGTWMERLAD